MVDGHLDRRTPAGTTPRSCRTGRSRSIPAAAVLHYAQEIFEGLKAYRHADGSIWTVPAGGQRRSACSARPAGSRCRSCRRGLPRPRRGAGRGRRRLGAGRRRAEPLPAPVHVRLRGVPRRPPGARGDASASSPRRSARTSPAAQAGLDLAVDELHPGRRRRHGRGQVRRQLRGQPPAIEPIPPITVTMKLSIRIEKPMPGDSDRTGAANAPASPATRRRRRR